MRELVLEHLRAVRAVIDGINGKVDQLTVRVGGIEQGIDVLHQDVSNLRRIVAEQGTRLDHLTDGSGALNNDSNWPAESVFPAMVPCRFIALRLA